MCVRIRRMKVKKGSLSNLLLIALEKTIDGYVRLEDFAYNTHIYAQGYDRPLNKAILAQTIRRLREKGLVETSLNEGQIIFKLSNLGEDYLKILNFDEKTWDKKWRIILFDIPENNRNVRQLLRNRLKEWGFKQWQKSVWVTKKDVMVSLKNLIIELKLEKQVALIESSNVFMPNIL